MAKKTSFEGMPHEEMLRWLDQANSGAVQGAADRLLSAASQITRIAEDLKIRPQKVEWKGEGAKAFHTWSADLANATLRLGDYSEGASKRLAEASDAIALAQAAIPRPHAGAQANLDAALAARNDPDASAAARKSAETLIAQKEANRLDAAQEMKKLAEAYELASERMSALERPKFPPPPAVIVPERQDGIDGTRGWAPPGGGSGGGGGATAHGSSTLTSSAQVSGPGSPSPLEHSTIHTLVRSDTPVNMGIDGVATLPDSRSTPSASPPGLPVTGRPEAGSLPGPIGMPPSFRDDSKMMSGRAGAGRHTGTDVRPPSLPGRSGLGAGSASRMPRDGGIIGGRPVAESSGRPTGGLPRGTIVGEEGAYGRGPMGHGGGMGGTGVGQSGIPSGRRLAGESGGIVGGRPQQSERSIGRPFSAGGSGLVRENTASENERAAGQTGRGTTAASGARAGGSRRKKDHARPDYLNEDEATWQRGGRSVVPPVID